MHFLFGSTVNHCQKKLFSLSKSLLNYNLGGEIFLQSLRPSSTSLRGILKQKQTLTFQPIFLSSVSSKKYYCSTATLTADKMAQKVFSKLPEVAKPRLYNINLKPDLNTFKFDGNETINLEVVKETDSFVLHAKELEIHSVLLTLADGSSFKIEKGAIEQDDEWMLLTLRLPQKVQPQNVTLEFSFTGTLNDTMHGFYRSSYKAESGETKYMASTQFESTYARMAFPCWDEPIYKAQFDVTMEVAQELTALSNMNVIDEQKTGAGTKILKFATTPIMSTYLVAFAVGDFEYIQSKTKSGMDVRIYTIPGKKDKCHYALDLATRALDWYTEWYGVPMALPKCDLIAIPDFSMGAMENWGLVTFREILLISDPAKTSTTLKKRIALVVAHELAHFWFGDLVTMKWWTDLWLKEGFASFMEYMFVGYNCPEFKIWLDFLRDEVSSGLGLDSLRNSHPIEVPIGNPNELDEIYDSITYAKSNSVNRMLCEYLGEETFRRGLHTYLSTYQFSNAETMDLWGTLAQVSGKDIASMMSSWTQQMGFPLVTVVGQRQLDGNRRELQLKQERFIADGGADPANSVWQVPIGVTLASNPSAPAPQKFLFTQPEGTVVIEGIAPGDWIKLNSNTCGFFRVNYSDEGMFNALLPAFGCGQMNVLDRYGFVDDLFALVSSGRTSAARFLGLLGECKAEREYVIWNAIDSGLASIANILDYVEDGGALKGRFNAFVQSALKPLAEELTWTSAEGEDSSVGLLRAVVLGRLVKSKHEPTLEVALGKFGDYVAGRAELDPNLRPIIFAAAARSNNPERVKELQRLLETVNFSEVEVNCVLALGQVSNHQLLEKVFRYAVIDQRVRAQDLLYLFLGSASSRAGREYAWGFFKNNCEKLSSKFGGVNSSLFQRMMKLSTNSHCVESTAADLEAFHQAQFDALSQKVLERPVAQCAESIRLNVKLLAENTAAIDEYLTSVGF